jgi:uncharacterized membrane protein
MIMKRCLILLILLMFSMVTFAKKLANLPEIFKPFHLSVDDQRFYVTEDTTIFIFSLKDFTLDKQKGDSQECQIRSTKFEIRNKTFASGGHEPF